jgi:arginase family enzyme
MPDLSIYFSALEPTDTHYTDDQIGSKIISNDGVFPDLTSEGIALIFVPEFRGDIGFTGKHSSTDGLRSAYYALHSQLTWKFNLYDLGNILPGNDLNDTYFAVAQVVSTLVKKRIIPVIIGGSQDLTLAMYAGYEKLEQTINTCSIDYKLDLGNIEKTANSDGYMSHLLMKRPCYLFNHANIGLQIPYAGSGELELFEKLYFDVCRLGEFNADFRKAEPHLRNSD